MLTHKQLIWTAAILLTILGILSIKTLFVLLSFIIGVLVIVALIIAAFAVIVHSLIFVGNWVVRVLGFTQI